MAGRPTSPTEIVNPAAVMTLATIQSERWRLLDLGAEINQEHMVIQWCARRRLLRNCSTCKSCNLPMHLTNYAQNVDGKRWKCRACNTTRSIRYQSFFSRSHLSLRQIIVFLYCWCPDLPLNVCIHEAAIDSGQTGVDWANFCREECATYSSRNPIQIGGFDANGSPTVVKIDETKYFHRKHHRGHRHEGHWVFGGTERTSW